jgi:hypothetical protein
MRLNDKSQREKEEIRNILRKRDGNLCQIDYCEKEENYRKRTGKSFDVHHVNENPNDWDWNNIVLAAHACNVRETPRGKGKFSPGCIDATLKSLNQNTKRSVVDKDRYTDEAGLRINSLSEFKNDKLKPLADQEFEKIVEKEIEVEREGLLDAMAKISGLTQQTCRNYLKAFINPHNGEYEELPKITDGKKTWFIRRRVP